MFEFEFEGFWVVVDSVHIQEPGKGSPKFFYSDWDYYGYSDIDYRVFDENDNQIFNFDSEKIEEEIIKRYKAEQEEARIEAQLEAAYF